MGKEIIQIEHAYKQYGEKKVLDDFSLNIEKGETIAMIGSSGTGKTTLAEIISNQTNSLFERLSAISSGVKDIREVISIAKTNLSMYNKKTVLFIDEIHRFNKSQQDA